MAHSYDATLRNRAIKAVQDESPARKASKRFGIGVATAIR